jgi:hypothetical protein
MNSIALLSLFLFSCSEKENTTQNTDADTNTIEDTTIPTDLEEVHFVTIGVFTKNNQGEYDDTGKTLYFEVGVPCYSWTRSAQAHDATEYLEEENEIHDHYNAGDNTSYQDGVFTWTEFGPEHTQEAIESTCNIGEDGVEKAVTADNYYEDHGGLFLRIIGLE